MKMKIVYICHPIAGDIIGNIEKIMKIIRDINLDIKLREVVPFAPYLGDVLALDDNKPEERNRGIMNDVAVLTSGIVNEVWVYGDRISTGMKEEINLAFNMGLPVKAMDDRLPDITFYTPGK